MLVNDLHKYCNSYKESNKSWIYQTKIPAVKKLISSAI